MREELLRTDRAMSAIGCNSTCLSIDTVPRSNRLAAESATRMGASVFTTKALIRRPLARTGDCHGDFKSVGELSFKTYVDWSTAEVVFLRFV